MDSLFAPPHLRRRLGTQEVLARYPELNCDDEQYEDSLPDVPHLHSVLETFAQRLTAETPAWEWTEAASRQVRRHPIYAGDEYDATDLTELPTLTKPMLRRHPRPFDHLAEPTAVIYTDKTSGTSGAPLDLAYSQQFMSQSLYLEPIKIMMRAGLTGLGTRPVLSAFLTDNPSRGSGLIVRNPLEGVGHTLVVHIDPNDPASLQRVGRLLEDLQPEVLSSKPNLFRMMLDRWGGRSPFVSYRPRLVVSGGAMLDDVLRHALGAALGSPVTSSYAISEAGYVGSECPHGRMHLDLSVHNRFEVIDEYGRPATTGELVITTLANSCMPLVRYRMGDTVTLADGCRCGRPGPVLRELRGRSTQIFDLGGGAKLSPTRYMKLFELHPAVLEYQLTQTSDRQFRLRVELEPDLGAAQRREALAAVARYIAAGMPVPVAVDCAEQTFDTAGAKFARFRSEVQHA
ncbi:phenylacetate--CoA ligase family protein [Micromonospora sp. DT178]|uniref:phenylacetate--CoA ligase family protein n=1 Tax=Micromonospora sp. DT178 TaxID=3393436 RepID=UPI003CFAE982